MSKVVLLPFVTLMSTLVFAGCNKAATSNTPKWVEGPREHLGPRPAPELDGLKTGMTVKEFEQILGVKGTTRPNAGPDEAIVDFDFDHKSVMVTVPGWLPADGKSKAKDASPKVIKFRILTDKLTAVDRQALRWKKWSEWVEAHSPKTESPEQKSAIQD